MDFDEEIREFLIESNENLANLDREVLQLEQNPQDMQLVSSAFRTIHTIKGTCGFFGYETLGSITHITENILSQVREGERELTPELISLVLESVDAVKSLLAAIEATGAEGEDQTGALRARLEAAHQAGIRQAEAPAGDRATAQLSGVSIAPAATIEAALDPQPDSPSIPSISNAVAAQAAIASTPSVALPAALTAPEQVQTRTAAAQPPPLQTTVSNQAQATVRRGPDPDRPAESWNQMERRSGRNDRRRSTGEAADAGSEGQLADSTIRVDVALLNRLMNLVGELVLARNQLLQDTSAQNSSIQQTSQRLNLITSELQEGVMKTRMQPIGVVWNKLPRVVRDLASQCGKRIRIEMEGSNTELDKTIIEAIKDPLTHIVRNACDHGIEMPETRIAAGKKPEGLLMLRAYHEGGVVNIEILDDGAGINPERVKAKAVEKGLLRAEQAAQLSERDALHLIFLPGFSTAAAITNISGRGVGMDVVKTNIEKIGGSVEVQNRARTEAGPGGGTTIRIKIPLTLAIIPGLVVTLQHDAASLDAACEKTEALRGWHPNGLAGSGCEEERFIIPQANLLELVHLEGAEQLKRVENVHGTPVFHHRNRLLPLVYLSRVLGRRLPANEAAGTGASPGEEAVSIIVVQAENRQMGLVVDRICDTQEIVVKPLGRQLKGLVSYVGATIMGDGRPALILDVAGLARLAGLGGQTRQSPPVVEELAASAQPQMMLLFRTSQHARLAVPLALVDRLEEISTAQLERAGSRPVLYYRGEILPLVSLDEMLERSAVDRALTGEQAQVIVFASGQRRLGLVVEQILDIVHEPLIAQRNTSTVPGLLGSAVISGRITDLVDLHALVGLAGENWQDSASYAPGLLPVPVPVPVPVPAAAMQAVRL